MIYRTNTNKLVSTDFRHTITIQPELDLSVGQCSPALPRLRAIALPGDGVKGKTWGPSSALSNVKQRPTITETQNRWKAISAPSLEKGSPRNLANIPTVGTVPEGEYPLD